MRKKVGTVLDERLILAVKQLAVLEGKKLNEIIEEALERYLSQRRLGTPGSIVAATAGAYSVDDDQFEQVMEEDFYAGE